MNMNFHELEYKWRDKVDLRNPYVFGEEPIDLKEFAELFKETFEAIKEAKQNYVNGIFPEDKLEIFEYIEMLCQLSKYTMYDCLQDESEENFFTVTCLIAQQLLRYANNFECYQYTEKGRTCSDNEDTDKGILKFFIYPEIDEDSEHQMLDSEEPKIFTYDIYKCDFTEIMELVSLDNFEYTEYFE